ncbi:MAG: potassium channel protein [Acidobacteriia bacterium]|nr:potassium channel protein [Terriglobia bacterium]
MYLRNRLILSLLLLCVIVLTAVAGYRWLGGPEVTLLDAFYMAVITVSTVGYGEVVDTHARPELRLFNIFVVLFGIGIMLYAFSAATAFIVEGELKDIFRRRRMLKQVQDMHDHFIVCGAGETGSYLVRELLKTGNVFVVIDHDEERLARISQLGEVPVLKGDGADEEILTTARIEKARGLASVLPEDKDNLLATVTARQLNPSLRIVARCAEARMVDKLLRAGANAAVSPNMIGGLRLASELIRPSVVSFLDVMMRDQSRTMRVEEIAVGEGSPWIGKKLRETDLHGRFDLLALAVRKPDGELRYNPRAETALASGDVLVVLGEVANTWKAREAAGNKTPHRAV